MKKIFLIAAAAAMVLSSCSKNSISEDTSDVNAIGFGTYSGTATKANASLVNGTTLAAGSFGVYGYLTTGSTEWTSNAKPEFMTNQEVAFDGISTYTYSPKRYWPKDETNYLSFYAYYPLATSSNSSITPNLTKATAGLGSYDFTVNPASEKQVDFMVSNLAKNLTWSNAGTVTGTGSGKNGLVKLTFRHMLTQVNVKLATTADKDTKVTITSITFKNIKNSGTLTVKGNAAVPSTDMATPGNDWWALGTGTTDFAVTLSSVAGATTLPLMTLTATQLKLPANYNQYVSVSKDNEGALLMLPNSFTTAGGASDGQIEIGYDYTTTIKAAVGTTPAETVTTSDKVTAYLTAGWDMNQKVTYYILLDLNARAIEFTADVTDWTPKTDIAL